MTCRRLRSVPVIHGAPHDPAGPFRRGEREEWSAGPLRSSAAAWSIATVPGCLLGLGECGSIGWGHVNNALTCHAGFMGKLAVDGRRTTGDGRWATGDGRWAMGNGWAFPGCPAHGTDVFSGPIDAEGMSDY